MCETMLPMSEQEAAHFAGSRAERITGTRIVVEAGTDDFQDTKPGSLGPRACRPCGTKLPPSCTRSGGSPPSGARTRSWPSRRVHCWCSLPPGSWCCAAGIERRSPSTFGSTPARPSGRACRSFQRAQRGLDDRCRVDLEVPAQRGSRVAAAEAVGAERHAAAAGWQEGADLLRHRTHVVGGDDDGPARRRELLAPSCARPRAAPCRQRSPRAMPSRASSLKLVTLQTSAATPCPAPSASAAFNTSPMMAPSPAVARASRRRPLARNRYMPRTTSSCASAGRLGCATFSFITVT